MWRRGGDGEVYAYMPNEQVLMITLLSIIMMMMLLMMMMLMKVTTYISYMDDGISGGRVLRGARRPL